MPTRASAHQALYAWAILTMVFSLNCLGSAGGRWTSAASRILSLIAKCTFRRPGFRLAAWTKYRRPGVEWRRPGAEALGVIPPDGATQRCACSSSIPQLELSASAMLAWSHCGVHLNRLNIRVREPPDSIVPAESARGLCHAAIRGRLSTDEPAYCPGPSIGYVGRLPNDDAGLILRISEGGGVVEDHGRWR